MLAYVGKLSYFCGVKKEHKKGLHFLGVTLCNKQTLAFMKNIHYQFQNILISFPQYHNQSFSASYTHLLDSL